MADQTILQKIQAARDEGYSDADITNYLSRVSPEFATAIDEGYSLGEISSFLGGDKPKEKSLSQKVNKSLEMVGRFVFSPFGVLTGPVAAKAAAKRLTPTVATIAEEPEEFAIGLPKGIGLGLGKFSRSFLGFATGGLTNRFFDPDIERIEAQFAKEPKAQRLGVQAGDFVLKAGVSAALFKAAPGPLIIKSAASELPFAVEALRDGKIGQAALGLAISYGFDRLTGGAGKSKVRNELIDRLLNDGVDRITAGRVAGEITQDKTVAAVRNFQKQLAESAQPRTTEEAIRVMRGERVPRPIKPMDEAAEAIDDLPPSIMEKETMVSKRGVIEPGEHVVPKEMTLRDRYIHQARSFMEETGDVGRELMKNMDDRYSAFVSSYGTALNRMAKVTQVLSKKQLKQLPDAIEGKLRVVDPGVQRAADEFRAIDDEIFEIYHEIGERLKESTTGRFKEPRFLVNHYPRIPDFEKWQEMLVKPDVWRKNAQYLLDTKQVKSIEEAHAKLYKLFKNSTDEVATRWQAARDRAAKEIMDAKKVDYDEALGIIRERQKFQQQDFIEHSGYLERERVAVELAPDMYIRDIQEALPQYYKNVFSNIATRRFFGNRGRAAESFLQRMPIASDDKGFLRKVIERELKGYADETGTLKSKWSGEARTLQTKLKIGTSPLAGLRNFVGGSVTTATQAGYLKYIQGLYDAMRKEGKDFAYESGAIVNDVISNLAGAGKSGFMLSSKNPFWVMFTKAEDLNRVVSANAGRRYSVRLTEKMLKGGRRGATARRELSKLLSDSDIDRIASEGKISEELTKKVGQRLSDMTQGVLRPTGLPGWASSPEGKMLAQFKQMAFRNNVWFKDAVLNEAKKGNFAPAFRFIGAGLAGGGLMTGSKAAYDTIIGKPESKREKSNFIALLNFLNNANILGLYGDLLYSASGGYDPRARLAFTAIGPTGTSVIDLTNFTAQEAKAILNMDIDKAGREFKNLLNRQIPLARSMFYFLEQ